MRAIIIIIVLIAAIILISQFNQFKINGLADLELPNLSGLEKNNNQKQAPEKQNYSQPKPETEVIKPEKNSLAIDTFITNAPKEGEIIEEKERVVFEFDAAVTPKETKGTISFETKIEGLDDEWQKTSSKKRTVDFPAGPKEYTFLVRAKIKDAVDPTPAKRSFKINNSPYFGKIKISKVKVQTSSQPSLITLTTYLGKEEEINITGWKIEGKKRNSFTIPFGTEKYYPSYQPEPTENIIVKYGDKIYLSGGKSPLGRNMNFRPNKCIGYFENYLDFPVSLPKNCPKPDKEEIFYLKPCCQEFINDMKRCEAPDYFDNPSVYFDSECTSYLNSYFNYGSCFYRYFKDEDFLTKEWHIYLNKNVTLENECDILELRDENGLLVNKYSYGKAVCR